MNKKDRPEVLRDGASIVGGPDRRKVIETPSTEFHDKPSIPGHDAACHTKWKIVASSANCLLPSGN